MSRAWPACPSDRSSLTDEVAVDLAWKILKATEADLGAAAIDPEQKALLAEMVEKRSRFGRKNGKGFYDYPQSGAEALMARSGRSAAERFDPDDIDIAVLKRRLLGIQALESARCIEERVVTDVREADVGSILGFGFAPFTGGTHLLHRRHGREELSSSCATIWRKPAASGSSRRSFSSTWRKARRQFLRPIRASKAQGRRVIYDGEVPTGMRGGSACRRSQDEFHRRFKHRLPD